MPIDFKEIFTAFMVLFAVIDITGSTPIIINLNNTGKKINGFRSGNSKSIIVLCSRAFQPRNG